MNICIVNGSPKVEKSNSRIIINYLISMLKGNKIRIFNCGNYKYDKNWEENFKESESLIFVFPLYADSIPSSLLRLLVELEKRSAVKKGAVIYTVVNNGFFEGKQNETAIEQVKIWSEKVYAKWGQGIGVGSGEMLPYMKKIPLGKGPIKNLGKVLKIFCSNVNFQKNGEDIYINPNYPRILWLVQATLFWLLKAKKNKMLKKKLFK